MYWSTRGASAPFGALRPLASRPNTTSRTGVMNRLAPSSKGSAIIAAFLLDEVFLNPLALCGLDKPCVAQLAILAGFDGLVDFREGEELALPQGRDNPSLYYLNTDFRLGLFPGSIRSRRKSSSGRCRVCETARPASSGTCAMPPSI